MAYIEGELLMEIGMCKWCGCPILGTLREVGPSFICDDCNEADGVMPVIEEDFERDDD